MENEKIMEVLHMSDCEWVDYTFEELDEYFHFVTKPNWNMVAELRVHGTGGDRWLELIPKHPSDSIRIYNYVHGTYVEQ